MWSETEFGEDGERSWPPRAGRIARGPSRAVRVSWGATSGSERAEQDERQAAVGTTPDGRGDGLGRLWFGGREQQSGFVKQMTMSGAEQDILPDLDEHIGEDML